MLDRFGATQTATTQLRYDLAGRLVARVDAEGRTNTIRYDRLGRVLETRDGLDRARFFRYDELGNRVASTDPAGTRLRFEHDDRGLLRRRYAADDASVDDRYSYDGFGRRTVARSAHTTLVRRYDDLDRVVSVTDPAAGTAQFVYDPDGRMIQRVVPGGALGFPAGLSVHYQYEERGLVSSIFDPVAGVWRFEYDAAGRPVRRTDPHGFERRVDYTPEGFVDTVELRDAARALQQRHRYRGYDALGNPHFVDRSEGGSDETTAITYDALSRVRAVDHGSGGVERFDYDRVGNRVYSEQPGGSASLDAADQLVALVDAATGTPLRSFRYDAAGRRTQVRDGAGAQVLEQYGYDALGRLTHFSGGSESFALAYDAEGHRRLRSAGDGSEVYDFGAVGTAWRGGGAVRRIEAGGLDRALAEVQGTQLVGLFRDGTGNVTATSDGAQLSSRRRYTAFGETLTASGLSPTDRGFASLAEEGSGGFLLYARARHYDLRFGRFLQRDPLGIEADQLYAYAANNPYRFQDPLGLAPVPLGGGGRQSSWNSGVPSVGRQIFSALGPGLHLADNSPNAGLSQGGGQEYTGAPDLPVEPALAPWEIIGLGRAAVGAVRGGARAAAGGLAAARAARQAYVTEAQGIRTAAEKLVNQGVDPAAAARWAVDARNALKLEAREPLPRVVRWGAEQLNTWRYGNPVGPSADALLATRTPQAVIESAGRTNSFLNWILGAQ